MENNQISLQEKVANAFRERSIPVKRDDIAAALADADTCKWIESHLTPETLLSKEEFTLYVLLRIPLKNKQKQPASNQTLANRYLLYSQGTQNSKRPGPLKASYKHKKYHQQDPSWTMKSATRLNRSKLRRQPLRTKRRH